ncbi:lectin L6-like [Littorina saxatilis]|uniref:Uncharacterized protein n=1 Tax=Littorina saxatilis TaxID=31220 RepID=A0AAN9B7J7_9CAEN
MEWKPVDGRLKLISINLGGVWGLAENGDIFYRDGTFENYQSPGTGWWQVEGKLEQLSVGWNSVWAVDKLGQVWYRAGIDIEHVTGTTWVNVPTDGPFKQVSVDRLGHVWAIDRKNDVYFRVGACVEQITGMFWRKVGNRRLAQLDAGKAGVWAVDENKEVFHRSGTYGENGREGEAWIPVGPGAVLLLQLSSGGEDMMMGVTARGELYMRSGMYTTGPIGQCWKRLPGELRMVDVYGYTAWGIDGRLRPVYTSCLPRSQVPVRMLRDTFF